MSIATYHQLRQPYSPNLCLTRPVPCSHLCVPAPILLPSAITTSCLCPKHYSRLENHATCVLIDSMVLAEKEKEISHANAKSNPKEVLEDETKDENEEDNLTGLIVGLLVGFGVLISLVRVLF